MTALTQRAMPASGTGVSWLSMLALFKWLHEIAGRERGGPGSCRQEMRVGSGPPTVRWSPILPLGPPKGTQADIDVREPVPAFMTFLWLPVLISEV